MYKSIGAKHRNWQLSQNNQYVSYALFVVGGGGSDGPATNNYDNCHYINIEWQHDEFIEQLLMSSVH